MAQTTIIIPLPSDGITTYQNARVERAPDSAGVPGAYTEIANVTLDPYNQHTSYTDLGGASNSWYRYRYANSGGTVFSSYTADVQAGQYTVKTWLKRDIPDADLTDADWDQWKDMALLAFRTAGLGRPITTPLTFTPGSNNDRTVNLDGAYRRMVRVSIYDAASGVYITDTGQWRQWGRQVEITRPLTNCTYKLYGLGEIRSLADIDDEIFPVLYAYMKVKYLDKRIEERENFRMFLNADKISDVKLSELLDAKLRDAKIEYSSSLATALQYYEVPTGY